MKMSKKFESLFDERAAEKNEENIDNEETGCIENNGKEKLFVVEEDNEENSNTEEVTGSNDIAGDYQSVSKTDSDLDLTQKLTLDELLILFSWLSVDDLIAVRRVCHSWRVAAQDKSLWRNRIFDLNSIRVPERKIKLMPSIQNIEGWAHNSLLDVILENVDKVKRLDVDFDDPLSPVKVRQVLGKYPQIESITLCACNPDVLECLEVLKISPHLKEVKFYSHCLRYFACTSHFMSIFTDSNNFPALTALRLSRGHFENELKHAHFRNILYNIIKNRSQQLSLLKLEFCVSESPGVLDAISQCVKLQELHLNVKNVSANLNIERMTQLRSLYLEARDQGLNFFTNLQGSLYNCCWSHLTKVDVFIHTNITVGVLKAIVNNARSLKSLLYFQNKCFTSDNQLENINTLLKLEKLTVSGIQITETDICHISKCYSLKHIALYTYDSHVSFNSSCFKYMLLKLNNLQLLNILKVGDEYLHLKNRQEIMRHITSIAS